MWCRAEEQYEQIFLQHRQNKALVESVAQCESIYQSSVVADAIRESMAPTTNFCMETTPPACSEALSRLPHARVFPWHKNNKADCAKTCGVCCERLVDGVVLTRLPCGHVYHLNCVIPWFNKTCTCPECRYELETHKPIATKVAAGSA